ncbi:MAG: pyridoxal 5'-phosphate synthase glutaminase subunit PdxT [Thermoplasmata archaeon]
MGVLALQGDVAEHLAALNSAMGHSGIGGQAVQVRRPAELSGISALLIPGGESTTIAKQLDRFGLRQPIIDFGMSGKPIMGTCAGSILLSSEILDQKGQHVKPLGLVDMSVRRNAFGRQAESFERELKIEGLDSEFNGIFIRAPRIVGIGKNVVSLASLDGEHVMVRENNVLALTFHPELANDDRVHSMFLKMVRT